MSKCIAFAATFALLCSGVSIATAADDGGWVTCKDGMKMHGGGACANHGGVLIPTSTSTPINTTKSVTPKRTATATKTKTHTTSVSNTTRKKVTAKATSSPTAKCMDGAMYFSRERRGACAKHGGVDKWYGW